MNFVILFQRQRICWLSRWRLVRRQVDQSDEATIDRSSNAFGRREVEDQISDWSIERPQDRTQSNQVVSSQRTKDARRPAGNSSRKYMDSFIFN